MSDLLHEALHRQAAIAAAMEGRSPPHSPPLGHGGSDSELTSDDEALTPVHTRPGTPLQPGTPRVRAARSSAGTPSGSRSTSPSRATKKRLQDEAERKLAKDPLRRFPNEITSRIFKQLDVPTLARCLRVCKKWRRSATINWAWYLRFQERRSEGPLNEEPVWTRRESKENWPSRYRSAFSMSGLQYKTAHDMEYEKARSDGYRTPREQREDKWAAESASGNMNSHGAGGAGFEDKAAAREYYKSLGGRSKVKGKGGFTKSSGPRDRTAFGDDDD